MNATPSPTPESPITTVESKAVQESLPNPPEQRPQFGAKFLAYLGRSHLKILELVILTVGLTLAIHELRVNTRSNLTASRAQIYQTENEINKREFNGSATKLSSIYAKAPSTIKDPAEYCRCLLALVSDEKSVIEAPNADALLEKIWETDSFKDKTARPDIVELRRMSTHISMIMDQMHSAFDYQKADVISEAELTTWTGYISDMGPHPLFLANLKMWRDNGYMSRPFAEMVQRELMKAHPMSKKVVQYFYPEMATPKFLDGLRDY